MHKEAELNRRQ